MRICFPYSLIKFLSPPVPYKHLSLTCPSNVSSGATVLQIFWVAHQLPGQVNLTNNHGQSNVLSSLAFLPSPARFLLDFPFFLCTAPPDVPLIREEDVRAREDDWDEKSVDVVLLTVNDFEFLAAYEILSEPSTAVVKDLGSVYFGDVGETKVALLQSEMGANNHAAAAEKGLKAKDYLHPNVIITLGMCFGLKEDKHKLGDLLISKSVTRYAQVRKNPDGSKVSRNDPFLVDSTIFSLFKHGKLGWTSPQRSKYQVNVYTGEILSGPELIDHEETREELKRSFPQALGGEMEAEGKHRNNFVSSFCLFVCLSLSACLSCPPFHKFSICVDLVCLNIYK